MKYKTNILTFIIAVLAVFSWQAFQTKDMSKIIISTEQAPSPIGPYNQAVKAGNTLYMSGQIAINPTTGDMANSTLEEETRQVMSNLSAVLEAADMDFTNVVKTSIFLSDMNNFKGVNEVYGSYFDDANAPARETVEVSRLPKDVRVEISMIAVD